MSIPTLNEVLRVLAKERWPGWSLEVLCRRVGFARDETHVRIKRGSFERVVVLENDDRALLVRPEEVVRKFAALVDDAVSGFSERIAQLDVEEP